MMIFYDIVLVISFLLYAPVLFLKGKWHAEFKDRLSGLDPSVAQQWQGKECVWIHAVSVGEVLAVLDFVDQIKVKYPKYPLVFSTVTQAGFQLAREKFQGQCHVVYAPLDFSWVVRKYITAIRPKIYISAETEIWPNLFHALHAKNVPIVQINGRISDKSYKGYKFFSFLFKRTLACVDVFCMQSALDAERIQKIGALPERIHVVGNLKFDNIPIPGAMSRKDLGVASKARLLIAGSTHPGEEEILIDAFEPLRKEFPDFRLVIAPRHVERCKEVIKLVQTRGGSALLCSEVSAGIETDPAILILDAVGPLRNLYGLANVVFIGKTLRVGGGQNMIEPVAFGRPTIVGPLVQNFKDVVEIFLKAEALVQIEKAEDLRWKIQELLTLPDWAETLGTNGQRTVQQHQGATSKTLDKIAAMLSG